MKGSWSVSRQINVVVTSTRRKRSKIPSELCLRDLGDLNSRERATQWVSRLESHVGQRVEAQELYAGDHWQIARSLSHVAKSAGWEVCLWICSPGYGVIKPASLLAPYSATFSMTHADSVSKPSRTERVGLAQRWWDEIARWNGPDPGEPRSIEEVVSSFPNSPVVVTASKSIVAILELDLRRSSERLSDNQELLIVSGGTKTPGDLAEHLLPCDARLQQILGGARMSLNVRILRHLLLEAVTTDDLRSTWTNILTQMLNDAPRLERFQRVSLTDDEVRKFILRELHHDQTASRSRLLRHLRDSGFRCEEKRFKSLFERFLAELDLP